MTCWLAKASRYLSLSFHVHTYNRTQDLVPQWNLLQLGQQCLHDAMAATGHSVETQLHVFVSVELCIHFLLFFSLFVSNIMNADLDEQQF